MAREAPVVVVGAGLAGLCTALACAPRPVLLLDAGSGTASALAQGGIAAALGPGDSLEAHVADTLAAGAGRCDPARVRQLVRAAPWAVDWLAAQGVAFDREGGRLALGREGGHGAHRIVHAGGDATGARIMEALARRVAAQARIEWRSGVRVDALLLRGGQVAGVRAVAADGQAAVVESAAVVLATGGIGGLYARSTNPGGHRGAGLALAQAAGARLRDLEYVQFHPTA
ncbi:MAG: FAD-binding protein, partial [Pseudomonadota bacterium]